jgi:hypothetical protein
MSEPGESERLVSLGDFGTAYTVAAALGVLLWCVIAAGSILGRFWLGPIEVFFLLAPLVHVPLGFRVARRLLGEYSLLGKAVVSLLPFGAILAAASFCLPAGRTAAILAAGWFLVCGLAALDGLVRLLRGGYRSAEGLCISAGFMYLAVGGTWLVLSRSGTTPMHFAEPIILLTAVHFHFTGFALPLVAAATGHELRTGDRAAYSDAKRGSFRFVAACIVGGPVIVAAGFVLESALLKLIGALLLAAASIGLAGFLLSILQRIRPRLAKTLLTISAVSLIAGMILAATYAVGEFTEQYWLLIPRMARLHGTANALGFTLCGLLGWTLAAGTESRAPDSEYHARLTRR